MKPSANLNIIAICVDALRRNDLSVYGFPFDVSAHICNLALKSTVFYQAYSPSSWTGTVVSSLFSGKPPWQHKVFGANDIFNEKILINKRKDYFNFCLSANPWISEQFGFNRGWNAFSYIETNQAPVIFDKFFEQVDKNRKPFFAYLHLMDLHGPFNRYWRQYCKHFSIREVKELFAHKQPRGKNFLKDQIILSLGKISNKIRKKLDKFRSLTGVVFNDIINSLSCLAKFDKFFGDFLAQLKTKNLLQQTAIIIFSDHGDERDEHGGGRKGHNHSLYQETVQVPFIVYLPYAKAVKIEQAFGSIQLYKIIENIQNNKNLIETLELDKTIIGQLDFSHSRLGYLLKENKKLIKDYSSNTKELYDLAVDPGETKNLASKMSQLSREYEIALDAKISFQNHKQQPKTQADQLIMQRLKSLGYL